MIKKVLEPYIESQNSNKLRGGYYTPKEIADFMVKWAVQKKDARVLEPSCGDGQFIESLVNEFGDHINIKGVELIPEEAAKALKRGNNKTDIISSEAFDWFIRNNQDKKYDVVIGNPPFIRYQNFPENQRANAFQIMKEEGLSPSRLTNSWLPFVVLSTRALKLGGRLAMVLPAELLQVTYAKELRKYLSLKYDNINVITFKQLVFPNIQQETVLFLGERNDCPSSKISLLEFNDHLDLEHRKFLSKSKRHRIINIDHDNEKWTQFYLSCEELDLIRKIEKSEKFMRLGDIASVDVGIVTGNNNFFILSVKKASELGITQYCDPIIGRSNHLSGITLTKSDYGLLTKSGEKVLLFNPGKITREALSKNQIKYVLQGEDAGVTIGYKCGIRLPNWWYIPSTWIPEAFLLRQIHEGPKIIENKTKAYSTDTVHRIRMKFNFSPKLLSAIFFNSLTFAFSEIKGRSYGGGVLELEPTEAENLLIPIIQNKIKVPYKKLDMLVRQKKTTEALDLVDSIVLKNSGLKKKEIDILRGIWIKLKNRRNSRNRGAKKHLLA